MPDLILPASADAVQHNKEVLTRWGNFITGHNFKAAILISANQDGKTMLSVLDNMPAKDIAASLRMLANNLDPQN